jgi:hypothetical protein
VNVVRTVLQVFDWINLRAIGVQHAKEIFICTLVLDMAEQWESLAGIDSRAENIHSDLIFKYFFIV